MPEVTDRIEKTIRLRAPRARVWKALTDSREFGTWFGVKFTGPFKLGETARGILEPTAVDPAVAKEQQQYAGMPFEITIDRMDNERLFAFRWYPFDPDPKIDYSKGPSTLVEFVLEEVPEGIMLTVTESGFDKLPLERRIKAFTSNEQGWTMMVQVIEKYLGNAR
jgi:uncharacterized protein YndB with AHSA1/START domain